MSDAVIGNVVGRFVISYLIVWALMWLSIARRDWRDAIRCTHRWQGAAIVLLVFSLGLLVTTSRAVGT